MIKAKKRKILLLPGDGIGPEVVIEVKKIIDWFNKKKSLDFQTEEDFFLLNQSIIFLTSETTSGPIPSPGNSKIFLFFALIILIYPRFIFFNFILIQRYFFGFF